jgi:hypothetical protein
MNKLILATILVVSILLLSATAQPASAGVEPVPFKGKRVLRKITIARYQLEIVGRTIDRFDLDANDRNIRGMYYGIAHLATKRAGRSLRGLENAQALFEQQDDIDYDPDEYLELLEEMRKYLEALKDEVIEIKEDPNLPDILKEPLSRLENILTDILIAISDFVDSITGINNDNIN